MSEVGRVALGRVAMTGRERIVMIMVRSGQDAGPTTPDAAPDPQMVDIAQAIMARQEGPFDPSRFHGRYAGALCGQAGLNPAGYFAFCSCSSRVLAGPRSSKSAGSLMIASRIFTASSLLPDWLSAVARW